MKYQSEVLLFSEVSVGWYYCLVKYQSGGITVKRSISQVVLLFSEVSIRWYYCSVKYQLGSITV